ncbi:MAG: ATP-binding protein [Thioalkalivibrionaceae bacterium]
MPTPRSPCLAPNMYPETILYETAGMRPGAIDWSRVTAARWWARGQRLEPLTRLTSEGLDALEGLARQKAALRSNIENFLAGRPCNHMLLWGSRGTGKSSLVRALPAEFAARGLRMIEVDRDDLADLPRIAAELAPLNWCFLVYCDDLTFAAGERGYRHLKTLIEGSLEAPPENVRLIVTSNRRHLVPEFRADNAAARVLDGELHESEAIEDAVALADRFGLSLSFYANRQEDYLAIIDRLFPSLPASCDRAALHVSALRFARARGQRSGRTARQFFNAAGGDPERAVRLAGVAEEDR